MIYRVARTSSCRIDFNNTPCFTIFHVFLNRTILPGPSHADRKLRRNLVFCSDFQHSTGTKIILYKVIISILVISLPIL